MEPFESKQTNYSDYEGNPIYTEDILGVYVVGEGIEPLGKVIYDEDLDAFCVEKYNGGWEYLHKHLEEYKLSVIVPE